MAISRRAVDAPHDFLSVADRGAISAAGAALLDALSLDRVVSEDDAAVGFMLLQGGPPGEARFVAADFRGCGADRALVAEALRRCPPPSSDVNEPNRQAGGFYERPDCARIGRFAQPLTAAGGGRIL
jgi:putative acetyltransferase